jgi:hypothetical protein
MMNSHALTQVTGDLYIHFTAETFVMPHRMNLIRKEAFQVDEIMNSKDLKHERA